MHLVNFLQVACLSLTSEPLVVSAEDFDTLALVLCGGPALRSPFAMISEANPDLVSKRTVPTKELQRWAELVKVCCHPAFSTCYMKSHTLPLNGHARGRAIHQCVVYICGSCFAIGHHVKCLSPKSFLQTCGHKTGNFLFHD